MVRHLKTIAPMLGGLALLAGAGAMPTAAQAGECCKPKPPCCKPKPSKPMPPGHDIHVPGVKIYPPNIIITPPSVNVNVNASAIANASSFSSSSAISSASADVLVFGGGGGGFGTPWHAQLCEQLQRRRRGAAEGAVLGLSHPDQEGRDPRRLHRRSPGSAPGAQVFPGQDVAENYEGELFRCVAGTKLSVTMADWQGKVAFDGGTVINCGKGEAFFHGKNGEVACRPQRPARDCNERSLLRRYGVGVKVLKMVRVETYTAYREETVTSAHSGSIVLDGGVGGLQF
jgi:hypothetical protein